MGEGLGLEQEGRHMEDDGDDNISITKYFIVYYPGTGGSFY